MYIAILILYLIAGIISLILWFSIDTLKYSTNCDKVDLRYIKDDIKHLRRRLFDVDNLYANDIHNTRRPKVDILSDKMDEVIKDIWEEISGFEIRINKLEKKKGV
jgi:hypothetical protein